MFRQLFAMLCFVFLINTIELKNNKTKCIINTKEPEKNMILCIHYGQKVLVKDYSYMVKVMRRVDKKNSYCGGTVISKKCVLTAAHCANKAIVPHEIVVATMKGSQRINKKRYVEKIFIPSWYNTTHKSGDVSILVLDKPIATAEAKIVKLDFNDKIPKSFYTLGWGSKAKDEPKTKSLRMMTSNSLTIESCQKYHRLTSKHMLCAEPHFIRFDHGDSGGPAISTQNNMQVGVVSWFLKPKAKIKDKVLFVYARLGSPDISNFVKSTMAKNC